MMKLYSQVIVGPQLNNKYFTIDFTSDLPYWRKTNKRHSALRVRVPMAKDAWENTSEILILTRETPANAATETNPISSKLSYTEYSQWPVIPKTENSKI